MNKAHLRGLRNLVAHAGGEPSWGCRFPSPKLALAERGVSLTRRGFVIIAPGL